jgi:hypothetical protein
MRIRAIEKKDIGKLIKISKLGENWFNSHLNPLILILEEDDELIAGIVAIKRDDFPKGFEKLPKKSIIVKELLVDPQFMGKSYDKLIFSSFLDEVKGKIVYFCVKNDDEKWLKLLEFFDFLKVDELSLKDGAVYLWDE